MGGWSSVLQHLQGPQIGSILGALLGWGPCIYYNTFARARDRSFYVLEAPIWGPKWGHFGGPDWGPSGAMDLGVRISVDGPKGRLKGIRGPMDLGVSGGVPIWGPEWGQFGGPKMGHFGGPTHRNTM